ncbi:MAG: alpha/beta fold hydrolase [bacterium]
MSSPVLLPGAEAFTVDGGDVGVVLSHGFTGSPVSMRPWAEHLAAAGYSVRVPRLPGHGTSWQEMNSTAWTDWYVEVDAAFSELRGRCRQVFAGGLSMGGTLVTRLAEERAGEVDGLVLVNPAYGMQRFDARFARFVARVLPSRPGIGSDIKAGGVEGGYDRVPLRAFVSMQQLWKVVVGDLGRVTAPILLFTSRVDHVVDPLSARLLHGGAVATTIQHVWLEDSYHVATMDNDAPTIFAGSVDFLRAHTLADA